jgi:hypothetical protein
MGIQIPFIHSYLDDLLAVPVTLGAYQIWKNEILKKKDFKITFPMVLLSIAAFTFHFEILMPKLSAKYISDIWDVACYLAGAIFFIIVYHVPFIHKKAMTYEKHI